MLREFLQEVTKLANAAESVQIVEKFGNGKTRYRKPDGTLFEMDSPAEPRKHNALDLSAVCDFANSNKDSVVWYSRSGVVCLIDDATRRDRVTLNLTYSPQMKLLQSLEANSKQFTQAELVLTLRTTFADCLADEVSASLLPAVRAVTFTKNAEGESVIDHGKASVGKRLTEKATGAVAIPEYVTIRVPVFATAFSFAMPIRCAVDVDASAERFKLIPLPLQIENAIKAAEDSIFEAVEEMLEGSPLYYGIP